MNTLGFGYDATYMVSKAIHSHTGYLMGRQFVDLIGCSRGWHLGQYQLDPYITDNSGLELLVLLVLTVIQY